MITFKQFVEATVKKKRPGDTQRLNSNGSFVYRLPIASPDEKEFYGAPGNIEYIK